MNKPIPTEDFFTDFSWPADWTASERSSWAHLANQAQAARHQGQKVVLATGVFDLLHQEHLNFLQKAAQHGDVLLVGLESDVRTRQIKGEGRPRQSQRERQAALAELPFVTTAQVLPEAFSQPQHHRAIIALLRPDILAVSSHSPHQDKKAALLAEYGGQLVVVHQHNPAVSTTQLLEVQ